MARKKKSWQERVFDYVLDREAAFSIGTLHRRLGNDVSLRSLKRFLGETGSVMSVDFEQYVPAWSYFQNATFLVKPQRWEVADGVLVPGHRFLPFHDFRLAAPDLTLLLAGGWDAPNGDDSSREIQFNRASRRTVAVPLSRAVIFYTLFGQEALFSLIGIEDESNAQVDFNDRENALVRLSVFDLGEFYRSSGFAEGDYLECRVLDWEEGLFSGLHRPAAEVSHRLREDWLTTMEDAFREMFDFFDGPMDIPTQLQYAYFLGDESVLEQPGGTIGELLAADNDLQFAPFGTNSSTIWTAPKVPERPLDPEEFVVEPEGVIGDLEAILEDIGSSLSEGEIEAFMRDELYQGGSKAGAVDRAFSGAHLPFAHEEQEKAFKHELEKLWRRVSRNYVPDRDVSIGPLRSRLLALYEKQLHWIRSLDAREMRPGEIPMEPMQEVGKFFSMITAAIELLNHPDADDPESLAGITDQMPLLESAAVEILDRAEEAVRQVIDRGQ